MNTARDWQIRPAHMNDLPAIERLLAAAALPLDGVAEGLGEFLVAVAGNRIIGSAGLEIYGGNALLRSVAVDAGMRDRGIGLALVQAMLSAARVQRFERVYLLTTGAVDFFARSGFAVIQRQSLPFGVSLSAEVCHLCPSSATVMVSSVCG